MAENIVTPLDGNGNWGRFGCGWRSQKFLKEASLQVPEDELVAKVFTDRYGRIVRMELYKKKPFEYLGRIEGGYQARKDAKRDRKVGV